jgi:integrase
MRNRYRLLYRGERDTYFCFDTMARKRTSLHTNDRDAAEQIVLAKNQALRQPVLNLQIAKAYLAGTDSGVSSRTWNDALTSLVETKHGSTRERWQRAAKDKALDGIRHKTIVETHAESLLQALKVGTVSTNVHLRKLHNFCLSMNWLPWPLIPKKFWPEIKFKDKRAITWKEHQAVVARELNPERKAFYRLAWHLGASQTDLACLEAENVDWEHNVISFTRRKTGSIAIMRFDDEVAEIFRDLAESGPLFPCLRTVRPGDRATEFKQRCKGLDIHGVTLHSYRYAWAERARKAGYPERFAQEALGHNSKAVHRAYARRALVELPPLSEYERMRNNSCDHSKITEPVGKVVKV